MVAYGATKNAVLLSVVTFLAGNVMNQFVDFNDDGSIEVHFGKVLFSTTTQTMSPAQSPLSAIKQLSLTPHKPVHLALPYKLKLRRNP